MSDTLSALEKALKPPGMKRIPFPLESYAHPSLPLSAKRLINLYAEAQPHDARTVAALVSTPGLVVDFTVGTGPIVAMNFDMPGRLFVVSGTRFYRISYPPGPPSGVEDLGDVGTPDLTSEANDNAMATIAVGVNAAVVCIPPNAFTCGLQPGDPLNQIGGDFPGAASVCYHDGYFVYAATGNTSEFFISKLLDPTAFDSLDFAFADSEPNIVRRVVSNRGYLWMMGEAGIEAWYNSGDQDFPFRRQPGSPRTPTAVAAPQSIAIVENSVFFVGMDAIVYRMEGFNPKRISTHAIEEIVRLGPSTEARRGLTYTENGHIHYAVTLGERTIVYDCATQAWHERASATDGNGPWRPNCAVTFGPSPMFGDSISPKVFVPVRTVGTDDDIPLMRAFIMPPLWVGTNRAFCSRLEVEMEVGTYGSFGNVFLQWSDDGGTDFNAGRLLSAGDGGQLRKRVFTTRLGSFRQRTFRIEMTGWPTFYGVDCDITAGAS